ncbi:MAG TPA: hypothetical protein VGB87_09200, partial [Vicinamibacteria bacterium]
IREIDLEAVRAEAERAFRVLVLAESRRDAEDLAALLSGSAKGDPWLVVAETGPRPVPVPLPDVAVLASRDPDLSPRLGMSAQAIRGRGIPLVTIVVGSTGERDGVVRPGEAARAAVPDLAAEHAPAVAQALLSGAPAGLRLALGRRLPPLRDPLFDALVEDTARANAIYALGTGVAETVPLLSLPLNLADIVVLTKNQIVMAYRIALAAGRRGTIRAVLGQTLGVIGSGFMLRQLARQLIGLVPVVGIAPKVAVAYAGTWAVGRAVAAWAGGGAELTKASVKRYYAEALDRGRRAADVLAFAAKAGRARRRARSR